MIGADEIDCGSFFDHIDDLLDFPAEDLDVGLNANLNTDTDFPPIWSTQSESLPGSNSVFSGGNNNSDGDLSAELSVPYEDIVQLEWLSNFVEDSFNGGSLTINNKEAPIFNKDSSSSSSPSSSSTDQNQFQISSPISVLDNNSSSSSSSSSSPDPLSLAIVRSCGRARSKRPRPATFSPRSGIHLAAPLLPLSDSESHIPVVVTDSAAEQRKKTKKNKKMKLSFPFPMNQNISHSPSPLTIQGVRKCLHCEVTKTPQWRAGPLGPKTLCNACGVRYKSGRLFPEYRPAASPTFVPCLHSNSHRKVVEMRTKLKQHCTGTGNGTRKMFPIESLPELIPNPNMNGGGGGIISVDYM